MAKLLDLGKERRPSKLPVSGQEVRHHASSRDNRTLTATARNCLYIHSHVPKRRLDLHSFALRTPWTAYKQNLGAQLIWTPTLLYSHDRYRLDSTGESLFASTTVAKGFVAFAASWAAATPMRAGWATFAEGCSTAAPVRPPPLQSFTLAIRWA